MGECHWGECGWSVVDSKELSVHVAGHARESEGHRCLWRGCPRYGEKKNTRGLLLAHVRTHAKNKPFKCEVCSRDYGRADALGKHMKTHEQRKEGESVLRQKVEYLEDMHREYAALIGHARTEEQKLIVENDLLLGALIEGIKHK